jgi:hypothetical protein
MPAVEITFCDRCDASIPQTDLERGAARQRGGNVVCAHCVARERRSRVALLVLAPLSLLAAAALGAVAAVASLSPRMSALEERLGALQAEASEPAAPDAGLVAEMRGIRAVDGEQSRAISGLVEAVERNARDLSGALEELAGRLTPLGEEIRSIKEHLLAGGENEGTPPSGAPGDGGAELEIWLPLVEDADPGVRLSALVALEDSGDERVTAAAIEALADPDSLVRAQAAQMLGARREERAAKGLIDLLEDANVRVRAVAVKALEAIAGSDFGYDPTDPEEERKKAIAAFREWARK